MAKVKSEGILIVRFPPPRPADLGRELRRKVENLLEKAGTASAYGGSAAGWSFDIRIKNPADLPLWTGRIRELLREQGAPPETALEASVRRGPAPVDLTGGPPSDKELAPLMFRPGADAWADLFVNLVGAVPGFNEYVSGVRQAIGAEGEVTHSCALPTYATLTIQVPDHRRLGACLAALLPELKRPHAGDGASLRLCTETRPEITSLGP